MPDLEAIEKFARAVGVAIEAMRMQAEFVLQRLAETLAHLRIALKKRWVTFAYRVPRVITEDKPKPVNPLLPQGVPQEDYLLYITQPVGFAPMQELPNTAPTEEQMDAFMWETLRPQDLIFLGIPAAQPKERN